MEVCAVLQSTPSKGRVSLRDVRARYRSRTNRALLVVLAQQGRARNPLFFASELECVLEDFRFHGLLTEHPLQLGGLG